MKIIDMHLHTRLSDGFNSPKELLEKLNETRLKQLENGNELVTVAIADHDTLMGGEICWRMECVQ
jgi:predicted metal-dependent phosphoesterase TrpH